MVDRHTCVSVFSTIRLLYFCRYLLNVRHLCFRTHREDSGSRRGWPRHCSPKRILHPCTLGTVPKRKIFLTPISTEEKGILPKDTVVRRSGVGDRFCHRRGFTVLLTDPKRTTLTEPSERWNVPCVSRIKSDTHLRSISNDFVGFVVRIPSHY